MFPGGGQLYEGSKEVLFMQVRFWVLVFSPAHCLPIQMTKAF